ncbi:hypothetical protein CVD28_03760 [Bacillus sp. M6-12]|uniref:hypothetical protein n=1 Tax=Bacillus sp. M6-12 TaxID=2054166 RepID=UPI000C77B5B6|nr:hypothetical protein [Bacillus sp. M6-12]PLS19544.1 hypothetical protein CVD28_03760 [Bacillus sp. M6-12]
MSKKNTGVSILDTPYAKEFIKKLENRNKNEGNILDMFTSMEDIDIFLEWIKPTVTPEILETMKFMLGVADQEGESVEVEGIGLIDLSIAPFIQKLNKEGYETLASCSGLMKEHPKTKSDRLSGYLSFLNNGGEHLSLIKKICDELELPCQESQAYFKPSLTVRFRGETDAEIEEKWKSFQSKLLG